MNCGADAVAPINVPDNLTITGINVSWYVQHTWQGDLQFTLRHNGMTVLVVDRPGSDGTTCGFGNDNYGADANTRFRAIASAATTYDTGNPGAPADNVIGDWLPENPYTPFLGTSSQGTWELAVHDCAGQDTGTIVAVVLEITGSGGATCYPDCNHDHALNVNDFVCFSQAFAASNMAQADCNHDNQLNVNDFVCFSQAFAAGCSQL
jgi:hypothetical protein